MSQICSICGKKEIAGHIESNLNKSDGKLIKYYCIGCLTEIEQLDIRK